jgi:hypothetical protein
MCRRMMILMVLTASACAKKDPAATSAEGSAMKPRSAERPGSEMNGSAAGNSAATAGATPAPAGSAAVTAAVTKSPSESDGADEVAQLVVHDVGSKALGNQTIEASCVAVSVLPAGDWTVAAARLQDCGDKTARSILWLFKRAKNGKWSEDYVGQPPRCWKGVPPDIAVAVTKATKIPGC